MEDVSEKSLSGGLQQGKGFINHVFNFDNDTKVELMNISQYLLFVLIPLSFINISTLPVKLVLT